MNHKERINNTYVLVKGTVTVENTADEVATANNANKEVILKNSAPFIKCIIRINNTQVDDAHDIDVVMTCSLKNSQHFFIQSLSLYTIFISACFLCS